jgi:hypothetical protein
LRFPHIVRAGADIGEYEAGDAMRRARGEAEGRAPAQRESNDRSPRDAKRIKQI